jgi:hypothetical protein
MPQPVKMLILVAAVIVAEGFISRAAAQWKVIPFCSAEFAESPARQNQRDSGAGRWVQFSTTAPLCDSVWRAAAREPGCPRFICLRRQQCVECKWGVTDFWSGWWYVFWINTPGCTLLSCATHKQYNYSPWGRGN